jgi:hypothetical protein
VQQLTCLSTSLHTLERVQVLDAKGLVLVARCDGAMIRDEDHAVVPSAVPVLYCLTPSAGGPPALLMRRLACREQLCRLGPQQAMPVAKPSPAEVKAVECMVGVLQGELGTCGCQSAGCASVMADLLRAQPPV